MHRRYRIDALKRNSGIGEKFLTKTLEGFAPSHESAPVLQFAMDYAENFEAVGRQGASLIFCGNTGTGKTHLACAVGNAIMERGFSVLYLSVFAMFRRIKSTWGRAATMTEEQAFQSFLEPDLLILDEIGRQFGSETEEALLFEVINGRYEAVKPTIAISNLGLDGLEKYMTEAGVDRFRENGGKVIPFTWGSARR